MNTLWPKLRGTGRQSKGGKKQAGVNLFQESTELARWRLGDFGGAKLSLDMMMVLRRGILPTSEVNTVEELSGLERDKLHRESILEEVLMSFSAAGPLNPSLPVKSLKV